MIAFDTNVLLRLLLNDDQRQAAQVQKLLDREVENSEPVLLTDIVLCELEWVLDAAYNVPRSEIQATIRRLLEAEEFTFMERTAVVRALDSHEKGKGDFSDYLIGESAAAAGASITYTFDRALKRHNGFSAP